MQRAAFVGGHRREGERASRCANLFDCDFGHHIELAVSCSFKALSVKVDLVVLFGFETEDFGGDVLDGVKKLTIAGKQERSIGPREVDCNLG